VSDKSLTELDGSVVMLCDVEVPQKFFDRITTGIAMLDEILGGRDTPGLLKSESVLVTGMPGTGKTTLSLQIAEALAQLGRNVLYNIGEESDKMLKLAARRIGVSGKFQVGKFEQVDELDRYVRANGVEVLLQDSIQSLRDGAERGTARLKSVSKKLHVMSKETDAISLLLGHVTKSGGFAGPQELAHDLDAHLKLSFNPDSGNRVFEMEKNRFGPAHMPYEVMLGADGLNFKALPEQAAVQEGKGTSAAKDRRDSIVELIKARLLGGEAISGYCFDRLGVDCSGNFWRVLVQRAVEQLRAKGHVLAEKKVNGRTHAYVEKRL